MTTNAGALTLVGGPARVGKTTLARRWAATRPVELVHLDHLLHAAAAVATGAALSALRKAPSIATHDPKEWLHELRCRDAVLWTAARAYAGAAAHDVIMEGGLWPDWVAELQQPHTAIFIVDTADDTADRLVDITRANPQSWMAQRGWPEEKIRKWAAYNRFRSETIAELAILHGYRVFDVATGIASVQDQALTHLATVTGTPKLDHPRRGVVDHES
ncbi:MULTISPECIES: hypothetical protein [unclassified Mycolicibacterium]|uniref:(d)CMP kinase n=1 Tax=Mycolicibacterium sp. CBMA 213 TaxID=1968788 RepID=A0A343VRL7_9MYCO|nr:MULTISPECIES: hypothetical protein [unclassified Mycolicibacterium]AVN58541.1 hypothetical protein B5P44_p00246 [Mycolicibacterium sp. CBMA 213]